MNRSYTHTLHQLPPDTTEAWLFEPFAARSKVEREWANRGKQLKLHCAYKSLLHAVLEEKLLEGEKQVLIRYPVIEGDEPQRFRLECYPVNGLFDGQVSFEAVEAVISEGKLPYYEVVTDSTLHRIAVPVRWVTSPTQKRQLVACGWIINQRDEGRYLATEFDTIFNDTCQYFSAMPLSANSEYKNDAPLFERLTVSVSLPMRDVPLAVGNEAISFIEAMHEDIYFSALEIIRYRFNRSVGDRHLVIGQVVPDIVYAEQPTLSITVECSPLNHTDINDSRLSSDLGQLEHWLSPQQITCQLTELAGSRFGVTSHQGRAVSGSAVIHGMPVKLAISGGQHANESSGIVAALRAAHTLKQRGNIDFTVCPLENPDGYALFRQLCENNPNHMHHAARYTSTGNDLTCGTSHESLIRGLAKEHLRADVHLNLHGYPAHEWTRPLSGYVPDGFTNWTIPKGFFIICRYHSGFESHAKSLLDVAIKAVLGFDAQKQQNSEMLKRFYDIVGDGQFEVAQGVVPYMISENNATDYPIEIITEAPDETVYGEAFRIAHESHYRVVLAVADALEHTDL
ncbi:MAG: Unknown protein [uncultured Thiotrichaceae bacterium]|uniref:Peptidase M14 carboxypeptidase A domain-containing protein n=1 Tax=uncultured Thiotrichaceae bacterium TaxID=298394 RepID=A0A6S6TSN9_9GAMM|nr:MAG: Unknown protein [uncultured Thiotrichaceae bacterium]